MASENPVRALRLLLGWTQDDVADRSGGRLKQAHIAKIEGGRSRLRSFETREGLARAFGMTNDELTMLLGGQLSVEDAAKIARERAPRDRTEARARDTTTIKEMPGWERAAAEYAERHPDATAETIARLGEIRVHVPPGRPTPFLDAEALEFLWEMGAGVGVIEYWLAREGERLWTLVEEQLAAAARDPRWDWARQIETGLEPRTLAERLEWALEQAGGSFADADRAGDLPPGRVSAFVRRLRADPTSKVDRESVRAVARASQTNETWLLTGEGTPNANVPYLSERWRYDQLPPWREVRAQAAALDPDVPPEAFDAVGSFTVHVDSRAQRERTIASFTPEVLLRLARRVVREWEAIGKSPADAVRERRPIVRALEGALAEAFRDSTLDFADLDLLREAFENDPPPIDGLNDRELVTAARVWLEAAGDLALDGQPVTTAAVLARTTIRLLGVSRILERTLTELEADVDALAPPREGGERAERGADARARIRAGLDSLRAVVPRARPRQLALFGYSPDDMPGDRPYSQLAGWDAAEAEARRTSDAPEWAFDLARRLGGPPPKDGVTAAFVHSLAKMMEQHATAEARAEAEARVAAARRTAESKGK